MHDTEQRLVPISCGVCRDLAPLVQDGIASDDSAVLVHAHLAGCPDCRAQFPGLWAEAGQAPPAPPAGPDDARVLRRLRRRVNLWLLAFLVFGMLLGTALLYSQRHGFLLILLFPLLGGVSYWFAPRLWRWVPAAVALLTGYNQITSALANPGDSWREILFDTALVSAVMAVLCLIGVLAAALLKYAFKGGKKP